MNRGPRWMFIVGAGMIFFLVALFLLQEFFTATVIETEHRAMQQPMDLYELMKKHDAKTMLMRHYSLRDSLRSLEDSLWAFNSLPMRNTEKFKISKFKIAILLLVHSRALYLIESIKLLRQVKEIDQALLIVSYDGIYADVAKAIDSIDFCTVKEIAFPWTYYWVEEISTRTNDKSILDKLHYRKNRGYLKHHMAWAFTQTMEVIRLSNPDVGPLFEVMVHLEDDVFVTRDFIQSTLAMNRARDQDCDICFGVVMGWHNKNFFGDKARVSPIGAQLKCQTTRSMAAWSLSVPVWKKFYAERSNFCAGYTSHWDDSVYLLHRPGCCPWKDGEFNQSARRPIPPLYLYTRFPRAIHMGSCQGIHYRAEKYGGNCTAEYAVERFHSQIGYDVLEEHDYIPELVQFFVYTKEINSTLRGCERQHKAGATFGSVVETMKNNNITSNFCKAIMDPSFRHWS